MMGRERIMCWKRTRRFRRLREHIVSSYVPRMTDTPVRTSLATMYLCVEEQLAKIDLRLKHYLGLPQQPLEKVRMSSLVPSYRK